MSCMNPFGSAVPTFQPFSPVKLSDFFERIRVAGLSEVIKIYEELENLGYNYASWAKGVATGKSVTGVTALDYLTGTALMGLGGDECRNLSQAQIDAIRLDMAKAYLKALEEIAERNNGVVNSDVDFETTRAFHKEVFERNGLGIKNWTLETPMALIRQTEGQAAVDATWARIRDSGGGVLGGPNSVLESINLYTKVLGLTSHSDPTIAKQAQEWIDRVPGYEDWSAIKRAFDALVRSFYSDGTDGGSESTESPDDHCGPSVGDGPERFGDAERTTSPLILDLNGDGVKTLNKTAGKHFDHAGDGFAERTGWVDAADGLLVRDLNNDGKITSGRELFGNHTRLNNGINAGKDAANGFEALKDLDSNTDGLVDDKDAGFASLRVWKDTNGNGLTDTGELLTLAQAGVKSLKVGYTDVGSSAPADAQGNQHQQLGTFTQTDGSTQNMHDVWFATSSWDTIDQRSPLALSAAIAALPEVAGPGKLGSLHQAMARDSSGDLQALVTQYSTLKDAGSRDALLQNILYHWAGVQDVDPASRANYRHSGNAIGDARKLEFMEEYFGRDYLGTWCWGERDPNPTGPAAVKLLALYEEIKTAFAARLDAQTSDSKLYAALDLSWKESTQTFEFDVSGIVKELRQDYASDTSSGHADTLAHVQRFARNLKMQGEGGTQIVLALRAAGKVGGDGLDLALLAFGTDLSIFAGTAGNDSLQGNKADNLFYRGAGDDTLVGAEGADEYDFNRGDGKDVILDVGTPGTASQGDVLQFGAGITPAGLTLTRGTGTGVDDLIIDLGSGDRVTLQYYFFGAALSRHLGHEVAQAAIVPK